MQYVSVKVRCRGGPDRLFTNATSCQVSSSGALRMRLHVRLLDAMPDRLEHLRVLIPVDEGHVGQRRGCDGVAFARRTVTLRAGAAEEFRSRLDRAGILAQRVAGEGNGRRKPGAGTIYGAGLLRDDQQRGAEEITDAARSAV